MTMTNKVILITGATGGIGKAIATMFANQGASVIVHYHTRILEARRMVNKFNEQGSCSMSVCADISSSTEVESMIKFLYDMHGRIDILINCAGIHSDSMSWKMKYEGWGKVIDVNLSGPFYTINNVLPIMRQNGFGRIVNISSIVGQIGLIGACNYAASKAGLAGLTKTIAKEVIKNNITVNVLELGYFNTGMFDKMPKDIQKKIIETIPMARAGTMTELTHTVRFLCSEKSSYLTGQVIHLNGGLYM